MSEIVISFIYKKYSGYGFLSENTEFAQACYDNNITFVGPTAEQLAMFGDKTAARKLAIECGVPVVPGTNTFITTFSEAKKFVDSGVGYPIIIKAAHGGGGRGMRVVLKVYTEAMGFILYASAPHVEWVSS